MANDRVTIYLIHHSHTDIGYTDLQESILFNQVEYLRWLIRRIKQGYADNTAVKDMKWTCETFCMVERFLAVASPQEQEDFFDLVRRGNFGISASYLNFTDLVDIPALDRRTGEIVRLLKEQGHTVRAALTADINGVSMGMRDVLIRHGVKLLMTNINIHHGLFPLYRRLQPFFWENEAGERLLVYCADHYHIGNLLGLENHKVVPDEESLEEAHRKISTYLRDAREHGLTADFLPMGISGALRDNGPPNQYLIHMANAMNARFADIRIEMVTIEEFYDRVKDRLKDAPVYRGDFTDWWANGVGSAPYATRHYRDAQRKYRLNRLLDPQEQYAVPALTRATEDNLFLYAEHTFGFNCSIGEPYRACVYDSELRKLSYASKASEAAMMNQKHITYGLGDRLLYHHRDGYVKVINPTAVAGKKAVSFIVETGPYLDFAITDTATGRTLKRQQYPHPKGFQLYFTDEFAPHETKIYRYKDTAAPAAEPVYRFEYAGNEKTADVVNGAYPVPLSYKYGLENDWLRITYEVGNGITSLYSKAEDRELLADGDARLFTPIYEVTPVENDARLDRFELGRNIRGPHARKSMGVLRDVQLVTSGEVFEEVTLRYEMAGSAETTVTLRMYRELPRLDCLLRVAKTLSGDIESVYLPLTLNLPESTLYLDKGGVPMRPGIDQLPGTGMEFYIADNGLLYQGEKHSYLLSVKDAPLVYMGPLKHHPIVLCDGKLENNRRDVYSWVMNNMWDTNFILNLSGYGEFQYSLTVADKKTPAEGFELLEAENLGLPAFGILDPAGGDEY